MELIERARELRRQATPAEKQMWRILRGRRFAGYKFRRQVPTGIYFLDFYCVEASLAVELDGGQHGFPDQRARDERRNAFLASQGILVKRFWNYQVWSQRAVVTQNVWLELQKRAPHPDNLPETSQGFSATKFRQSRE